MASTTSPNLGSTDKEYKRSVKTTYALALTTNAHGRRIGSMISVLRGIQALGGEAGFKKWAAATKDTQPGDTNRTEQKVSPKRAVKDWPYTTPAEAESFSALVYTMLEVDAGGYTGSGHCWGVGLGEFSALGALFSDDPFPTFAANTTSFLVQTAGVEASGVFVEFSDASGTVIGMADLVGDGIGAFVGASGDFSWS